MGGWKQEFAEFKKGDQAAATQGLIHYGQDAKVFFIHQPEGIRGGGIGAHAEDAALHDIGHLGGDVGNKLRGGHPKRVQDEIDAVIRVPAAGGHGLGHAGAAFEFRVPDGRTDGIRVRVTMADY